MKIKNILFFALLFWYMPLFSGDIYEIMQEAPQTVAVKKPTQIPMKMRITKTTAKAPAIEKEQPSMTTIQGLEYLAAEERKRKEEFERYHQQKVLEKEQLLKKKRSTIERRFNNVGLKTLQSQKDYEKYKQDTKKLLPTLIKYSQKTQTKYNDPIIKALEWHDPTFVYELLELPEYYLYTNFNFKSNSPRNQENLSGQEFLDKLKDSIFAGNHGYQDRREINQMTLFINYMLSDPDLGSKAR